MAIIEAALWEGRGGVGSAVIAAEVIRAAGYRKVVDGAIEAAAREALDIDAGDKVAVLRGEIVLRGARSLDDPANARYYASTVEAMRKVLADISGDGGDGDTADIVEAIRRAGRGGDASEVGDPS